MARSEGRILTSIWTDPQFVALDGGSQRMYLFLLSQPDLNHLGVITLAPIRWTSRASDLNIQRVLAELSALATARFVIVDETEEQLMIRTFLRNDRVCRQPNVLRAALAAIPTVTSAVLRSALYDELVRIEAEDSTDRTLPTIIEMKAQLKTLGLGFREPLAEPFPEPFPVGIAEGLPNPLGDRGEGLGVTTEVAVSARAHARGTRIPLPFAVTQEMVAWAREHCPGVDGRYETQKFVDYWKAKSGANATKVDWLATWRNWMRNAAERGPAANGQTLLSTAEVRAHQAAEAGRRLQERMEAQG